MTDNFYAPPHSIEAEQAVIGGLLLDDDSSERVQKVLAMLKPDSFYSRPHKILFEEITRMHREQKPVDGLTLFDELERKSLTASVGGFAYIAEIAKNTPSAANIVAYAMQVRETAMERYAINRMTEATELLYSRNGMTATQKYEAIQSIFTQLTDHAKTGSRRGLRSFGEVMEDWVSDLEKRFDPSGEQRGMSTGIPSLDRMLSPKGLVKGSLFVIGARPKMGKTTLYSQMAINCAVHEKKPALMFSLEMPGDQILEKLVGQKSGVNPNIFYLPATNDADDGYQGDYDGDFNRAIETANRLSEIDMLYIDDTPGLSLAQIVSESRRIKREKGCVGMILVDYPANSTTWLTIYHYRKSGRWVTESQSLASPLDVKTSYSVDGIQVVGARNTGWTAATGTPLLGSFNANQSYTVGTTYTQSEVAALATGLQQARQRILALETALRLHGLID